MSLATQPTLISNEWYDEVPRRIVGIGTFGLILMFVALGGFGYWAFSAPLAAAVVSQGSFVATGHNKIVQHLEGGIIKDIMVEEGQTVEAGQALVVLDTTAAQTRKIEMERRLNRLKAMEARLLAEYRENDRLSPPGDLMVPALTDPEIGAVLRSQRLSFDVARQKLTNDLDVIRANVSAQENRILGYEAEIAATREQIKLLEEDREAKSKLVEKGLTRKTELNALSRAIVDGQGQLARLEAEVAESRSMIGKFEKQIKQTRFTYSQAAVDELQSVQAEIDTVREKMHHAEDVLRRTDIEAPVSGTVVRLHYHTPGGVIETGKPIAEILPNDAALIIETLIPRTEIDSVHLGQHATIRLVALNQRTTPVLDGEVYYVSADALPDNSQGGPMREVYLARISLAPQQLQRVQDFSPTPGMPAEILIATRERTFMQYLTKPIVDSMARAFREE